MNYRKGAAMLGDLWAKQWTIVPSCLSRLTGEKHALAPGDTATWRRPSWRNYAAVWRLDHRSPRAAHQVVERYARYFRREFGYDFVQYDANEPYRLAETQAWLWTTVDMLRRCPVLGACCVRSRTYSNCPESFWALQWVWLHPYARNQGLFTHAFPVFLERYGAINLEPPLSAAMAHIAQRWPTRTCTTAEGAQVVLHVAAGADSGTLAYERKEPVYA
jgi:hypothetical protein